MGMRRTVEVKMGGVKAVSSEYPVSSNFSFILSVRYRSLFLFLSLFPSFSFHCSHAFSPAHPSPPIIRFTPFISDIVMSVCSHYLLA